MNSCHCAGLAQTSLVWFGCCFTCLPFVLKTKVSDALLFLSLCCDFNTSWIGWLTASPQKTWLLQRHTYQTSAYRRSSVGFRQENYFVRFFLYLLLFGQPVITSNMSNTASTCKLHKWWTEHSYSYESKIYIYIVLLQIWPLRLTLKADPKGASRASQFEGHWSSYYIWKPVAMVSSTVLTSPHFITFNVMKACINRRTTLLMHIFSLSKCVLKIEILPRIIKK